MSDVGVSEMAGMPGDTGVPGEASAGAMMRSAREAAGLHIAALAVSMKIPVKKLEALEADRLDLLHDAVFVRALAASVCRALKIDPVPVLSKLPLNKTPKLTNDERSINTPFRTPGKAAGISVPASLFKPWVILAAILVLAGLAIYLFPAIKLPEWVSAVSTPADKPSSEDAGTTQQVALPPVDAAQASSESASTNANVPNLAADSNANPSLVIAAPEPVAVVSPPVAPAAKASLPTAAASKLVASASKPLPATSHAQSALAGASRPVSAASGPAGAASKPVPAALPSTGMVVFKAKGPTWVKVVDAKGVVQLSKMLAGGDVVGASGAAPLSVVVGRVDVTEVEVHGQAYPLAATSKDNVARFEVK